MSVTPAAKTGRIALAGNAQILNKASRNAAINAIHCPVSNSRSDPLSGDSAVREP